MDVWERLVHTVEGTWQPRARFCSSEPEGTHAEWWGMIQAWHPWGKPQGTEWATEIGKSREIPESHLLLMLLHLWVLSHYFHCDGPPTLGLAYFISTVDFNSNTTAHWTLSPWLHLCPFIANPRALCTFTTFITVCSDTFVLVIVSPTQRGKGCVYLFIIVFLVSNTFLAGCPERCH